MTVLIPTVNGPQKFLVTLNGIQYQFTINWNAISGCYVLDIADSSGNPIVESLAMVPGSTLLSQFSYLQLGFDLFVQNSTSIVAIPQYADLGVTSQLYAVVSS